MTNTFNYEFKTQRGANIEVEIKVTHEDSYKYSVECIKVNGEVQEGATFYDGCSAIKIGMQGWQPLVVQLPTNIISEFRAAENAEFEAEKAARPKRSKSVHNVCPRCGTYCYGDCSYY